MSHPKPRSYAGAAETICVPSRATGSVSANWIQDTGRAGGIRNRQFGAGRGRLRVLCACFFTVVVFAFCLTSVPADVVVTVDNRGKQTSRNGTVTDLKGDTVTLQLASGREVAIPYKRVVKLESDWLPVHQAADARYRARDFSAALDLYRDAFNEESRRWVKRKLLAQVIWCQQNTNRYGEACQNFRRLVSDDANSPYFGSIPLQWQARPCPADVKTVVQPWQGQDQPVLRLMAASWLLADDRNQSVRTLRELGRDATENVRVLAVTQLFRAEILTLDESRIAWLVDQIKAMPSDLRAGPYYLLGQAHARFDHADEAALAYLRVPALYPDHAALAQHSLWEAGRSLHEQGNSAESVQLFRQTVALGRETEPGRNAAARLDELLP